MTQAVQASESSASCASLDDTEALASRDNMEAPHCSLAPNQDECAKHGEEEEDTIAVDTSLSTMNTPPMQADMVCVYVCMNVCMYVCIVYCPQNQVRA